MTTEEREQFLADRLSGIGGSDVADVLSLEPWGCARRLYYEKRQVPPDYADESKEALFERGHVLEPLVAAKALPSRSALRPISKPAAIA